MRFTTQTPWPCSSATSARNTATSFEADTALVAVSAVSAVATFSAVAGGDADILSVVDVWLTLYFFSRGYTRTPVCRYPLKCKAAGRASYILKVQYSLQAP